MDKDDLLWAGQRIKETWEFLEEKFVDPGLIKMAGELENQSSGYLWAVVSGGSALIGTILLTSGLNLIEQATISIAATFVAGASGLLIYRFVKNRQRSHIVRFSENIAETEKIRLRRGRNLDEETNRELTEAERIFIRTFVKESMDKSKLSDEEKQELLLPPPNNEPSISEQISRVRLEQENLEPEPQQRNYLDNSETNPEQ